MIKACVFLAAAGTASANTWTGQPSAAFVGTPVVAKSSPWGLGSRWLSTGASTAATRVSSVSRNAVARLGALSMKLGEDERVRKLVRYVVSSPLGQEGVRMHVSW